MSYQCGVNMKQLKSVFVIMVMIIICGIKAITAAPNVIAWGDNTQTNVPAYLTNAIAVSAGFAHSLALTANGKVIGWGDIEPPPSITQLSNIVAIASGVNHSLALLSDGTVRIWGNNNDYHQLDVPDGLSNVVKISFGSICVIQWQPIHSTNTDWNDLDEVTVTNENQIYVDLSAKGQSSREYRILQR